MIGSRLLKYAGSDDCELRDNHKHQVAAAHALKIFRSASIYSFIPKNACSTMRLSVAIANCCIRDASGFNWIHKNNATFRAGLDDLVVAKYTFVLLRDPFARLASCFLDKIVSQAPPARRLPDLVGRSIHLEALTFTNFVELLHESGVLTGNIHWRPQTDFLVYDQYDDYFAVEDFATAAATLKERADLEVIDARPMVAHGLDQYRLLPVGFGHSRTSAVEIARLKRNGECPDPRSLFTQEIVDAVARLYADDFALYAEKIGLPTMYPTIPVA